MKKNYVDNGPMLNAYPDSMGGTMADIVSVLSKEEFTDVFQTFYILPSILIQIWTEDFQLSTTVSMRRWLRLPI